MWQITHQFGIIADNARPTSGEVLYLPACPCYQKMRKMTALLCCNYEWEFMIFLSVTRSFLGYSCHFIEQLNWQCPEAQTCQVSLQALVVGVIMLLSIFKVCAFSAQDYGPKLCCRTTKNILAIISKRISRHSSTTYMYLEYLLPFYIVSHFHTGFHVNCIVLQNNVGLLDIVT